MSDNRYAEEPGWLDLEATAHPMTNSDRLQEIRERAAKPHDYFGNTSEGNQARDDRIWLLQLITEQQSEIEQLRTALEPGKASAIVIGMFDEAERLGHSRFSSKHALSFFIEEIERLKSLLNDEELETRAKGYRKQERPM